MDSLSDHPSTASATLAAPIRSSGPHPDSTSGNDSGGDADGEPPSRSWAERTSPIGNRSLASDHPLSADPAPNPLPLEDPLGRGIGWMGGVLLALLTAFVPLASVIVDRAGDPPEGAVLPTVPTTGALHGPPQPAGFTVSGAGEPGGGNPGGKPQ